jgi:hypothetical protein
MMRPTSVSRVLLLLVLAACNDREAMQPPGPVAPPVSSNAWIHLSDSAATAGDVVSISAFARSTEGGAIGSFTARLLYDSLMLQVVEADSIDDGALRALNPMPGEYRIAGASANGLRDGLLFRVRATVRDPKGLRRIGLLLDELHSTRFAELTKALEVKDGRRELIETNPRMKVAPPARP